MKNLIPVVAGKLINVLSHCAPSVAGKIGFRLFCYPFRSPLRPHQKAFLKAASQVDFEYGGNRINVNKWGSGPRKVLLLHGWQSHSFRWKNYVEAFDKNDYTLYALDAAGHGLSTGSFLTVPLYAEVIEKFIEDKGPFHSMVGHSLGAFTLLYLMQERREIQLSKAVLLAPPGEAREFFSFYKNTLGLSDKAMGLVEERFIEVVGRQVSFFSAAAFASHLSIPGLLIHDVDDRETSAENSRDIQRAWKNSQLILTKGLGHNLKSPEVVKAILEFLETSKVETVAATGAD